jgi:hypothetical protein
MSLQSGATVQFGLQTTGQASSALIPLSFTRLHLTSGFLLTHSQVVLGLVAVARYPSTSLHGVFSSLFSRKRGRPFGRPTAACEGRKTLQSAKRRKILAIIIFVGLFFEMLKKIL